MLDRILNINPQEKYKNGLKIHTHNYAVNRNDQGKHNSKDSALFSPLAKLLAQINWKILNIEFPSEDEMLFNFLVNDIEFITVINFREMYNSSYQEFSIYNSSRKNLRNAQTNINLKVKKESISILDTPDPIKTEYIEKLFSNANNLKNRENRTIKDLKTLVELVSGIELQLKSELEYILKVIYTFITTRNNSRVKNNFHLKTHEINPIIMQKVAIIYAD